MISFTQCYLEKRGFEYLTFPFSGTNFKLETMSSSVRCIDHKSDRLQNDEKDKDDAIYPLSKPLFNFKSINYHGEIYIYIYIKINVM